MEEDKLTNEKATEILMKCVVVAQSKGAFSIKDASFLFKVINQLKEETGKTKENYDALLRAIVIGHGKGCYSLEEAALIEGIVNFLEETDLVTKNTK
jgi:hypothetical protein